jgi:putative polyhydroxyalkanoate system protein
MGRPVTVTLEHQLGTEAAKKRIDEKFGALKESIAGNVALTFEESWEGDKLRFTARGMGQRVSGELDVFPEHVRITVALPFLLAGMAEAITGRLQKQGQILLEDKSKV